MKTQLLLIAFQLINIISFSQAVHEDERYVPETDPLVLEKLAKWQDLKFGLLMHWGPYSQWGIVESWSICAEDEDWCRRPYEDYVGYKREYESLKKTFNPTGFDPELWANAAKNAGMKYVVFTTKHHDGFCMFDSKYTDYKITSTECPFHTNPRSNVTKEIFNAFRNNGLWVGAYFSKPDWNSTNYWWPNFPTPDRNVNYDPNIYPERWEAFVQFTHNQIAELMTDYGSVDILWLDGGWVSKKSADELKKAYDRRLNESSSGFIKNRVVDQDIRMDELVEKVRKLQPGLIVVDRAVYGKNQNYLTPENRVPDKTLPYPWESCIISGGGWSFTPDAKYMSGREGIHLLVDIVAKGGNLLLNVAPGPDGKWQQGAYNLLEEFGLWLNVNGEAIYGSKPLEPNKSGKIAFTQGKNREVYLIYLADENEVKIPKEIIITDFHPKIDAKFELLGSNSELNWKLSGNGVKIEIPSKLQKNPPCKNAWVIKTTLNNQQLKE